MPYVKRWTDSSLRALVPPDRAQAIKILVEPRLYLYIRRRAGDRITKQWQFRTMVDGVRRVMSFGEYPAISYAQARTELLRQEAILDAARKGEAEHPVVVARQARRIAKGRPTVAQVFDEWIADKRLGSSRKRGLPVRERTVLLLTLTFNRDIRERIGHMKMDAATRSDMQACIDAPRQRKAPGTAAHVYKALRGLVNFALRRDYIPGRNPMQGIENPRPYRPAKPNVASDAEVKALLATLDESKLWMSTRLAIEFQLLTGARPEEVRLATWSEVDIDRGLWSLPAERTKCNRPFRIHLSSQSIAILAAVQAIKDEASDYVFPGAHGKAMEKLAVGRALRRIAERRGDISERLKAHDLRKTFRTMLSRLGVQPHISELCLNHQEPEVLRRVYDGHDYFNDMAAAWDRVGAHLAALRGGGAEVIPMKSLKSA